jgi:2-C-methyl-D-erythritol 2,4-cyclodiphosphate synthase
MLHTGIGHDVHRLVSGRGLVLGGVAIPHELGLDGHSDADVLTHAVIDAVLGAAGLGDIGEHFPDTDPRWERADSLDLLRSVVAQLAEGAWHVVNVDVTVMLERPAVGPHREAIRSNLAAALEVSLDAVNVKATTGEGLGYVGRGEGAAALAIASVER